MNHWIRQLDAPTGLLSGKFCLCKLLETSEVALQHHALALHGKNFLSSCVSYFRNFALSSL